LRGIRPPPPQRFGPENNIGIENATENWFGKIFRLVKYYFLGLFEQLHPDFSEHSEELQRSCFGTDIDCGRLGHQLYHMHDAVKTTLPEVRQVTNIRTIWEAFNKTPVNETLLGEVHKLLRTSCISYLYLWHRRLPSTSFLPCAS